VVTRKTIEYRHGKVSYLDNDFYIGRALSLYGEREEKEVEFVCSLVKSDDVVVDVGANIGLITVPLAQKAAQVHCFEPQPRMYELLRENIEQNGLLNVSAHQLALGAIFGKAGLPSIDYDKPDNFGGVPLVPGSEIKVATLDSFNLDACNLIKIDVEGMEADVLAGAKETIKRHHPLLYVENDRIDKSVALITLLNEFGYEMYWHAPYLYNPDNFNGVRENIFPNTVTVNMLCVPKGLTIEQTKGLRRVTSIYDRESGRAHIPAHVKPPNGWAAVARFGGIGDNLMAASAAQALKKKGLKVEVITAQDCAWQVFQHNPNIDKLSVKSKSDFPQMGTLDWQKWFRGRADEYDGFAHLSHSCEGQLAFFPAMTQFHWPAHVRRKIANKNYLEMVHDIANCAYEFGPLFYASEDEHKKALETKAKVGDRCITVCMSGSRIDKLHPRLPGIAARLIKELDAPVVLLGDEGCFANAKLIEKFVIDTNGTSKNLHVAISSEKDQTGYRVIDWPVRRTLSFALVSDIVIGPDTGIMWGVAFEPMPKIVLLGHASPENITKHWLNTTTLHADASVPCWPCHQLHDDPPVPTPGFHSFCTPNAEGSGAACISSISIEAIVQHTRVLWETKEHDHGRRDSGIRQADHR
jgi:FkbM family methyltransferase